MLNDPANNARATAKRAMRTYTGLIDPGSFLSFIEP
jgi:hypothetical protein